VRAASVLRCLLFRRQNNKLRIKSGSARTLEATHTVMVKALHCCGFLRTGGLLITVGFVWKVTRLPDCFGVGPLFRVKPRYEAKLLTWCERSLQAVTCVELLGCTMDRTCCCVGAPAPKFGDHGRWQSPCKMACRLCMTCSGALVLKNAGDGSRIMDGKHRSCERWAPDSVRCWDSDPQGR